MPRRAMPRCRGGAHARLVCVARGAAVRHGAAAAVAPAPAHLFVGERGGADAGDEAGEAAGQGGRWRCAVGSWARGEARRGQGEARRGAEDMRGNAWRMHAVWCYYFMSSVPVRVVRLVVSTSHARVFGTLRPIPSPGSDSGVQPTRRVQSVPAPLQRAASTCEPPPPPSSRTCRRRLYALLPRPHPDLARPSRRPPPPPEPSPAMA